MTAAAGKLTVRVEAFTPRRSNTLVGFCTVTVPEMRLRILDLSIREKGKFRWVDLTAKPQVDRSSTVRRDDRGNVAYSPVLEFTDRPTHKAFSARVIAALLEHTPAAFEQEHILRGVP